MHDPSVPKRWWWLGLAGLLLAMAIPIVANLIRNDDRDRCALDGQVIEPIYRVTVEDKDRSYEFCCLLCAELWRNRTTNVQHKITLIDETSGESIDARDAFFVYSSVFNNAPTGDRRHVFRNKQDAEKHAATYRGRLLMGDERPFAD